MLENAPKNAKYTSSEVQKEILSIVARKVQKSIREEIGTSKFCIMADEARDESKERADGDSSTVCQQRRAYKRVFP